MEPERCRPAPGKRLERWIEVVEARAGQGPARSVALGAGLGIAAVGGGIGVLLLVWFVLVNLP